MTDDDGAEVATRRRLSRRAVCLGGSGHGSIRRWELPWLSSFLVGKIVVDLVVFAAAVFSIDLWYRRIRGIEAAERQNRAYRRQIH